MSSLTHMVTSRMAAITHAAQATAHPLLIVISASFISTRPPIPFRFTESGAREVWGGRHPKCLKD